MSILLPCLRRLTEFYMDIPNAPSLSIYNTLTSVQNADFCLTCLYSCRQEHPPNTQKL